MSRSSFRSVMRIDRTKGAKDAVRDLTSISNTVATAMWLEIDIKGFFDHMDHSWLLHHAQVAYRRSGLPWSYTEVAEGRGAGDRWQGGFTRIPERPKVGWFHPSSPTCICTMSWISGLKGR